MIDLEKSEGARVKSLLISSTYFPPQVGGISSYMSSIVSVLGPDRVCCLTGVSANHSNSHGKLGVRVYRRPILFAEATYLQRFVWGATIFEIMARERPQVIQLATTHEGSIGLWFKRWLKLPFVVYAHGNEILYAMQSERQSPRLALQQADRVLVNSRFTRGLVREIGVKEERAEIVHPGCDIDRFQPLHPDRDFREKILGHRYNDRVILTVGGLVPRKGHDLVIQALPRLLKTVPDVTYVIVGSGPQAQLKSLAYELGVAERVIFVGKLPDEDLPAVYALCDLFVMPSRELIGEHSVEGFGMVFLEANACGKPVVGGQSGGINDAVVDGISGLLVNPSDPNDLAETLKILLTNRSYADQLGQQGRARVLHEFSWERVGRRIQGILDSVVQSNLAIS